jgi:prepilin-type N-terminal cleavage/methylation domain-containing protein/prepilin-type processing-associated H-X9-DG protein
MIRQSLARRRTPARPARRKAVAPAATAPAFTLIELLVVIAIIAVLAAILFPVFAQARGKARQTTCASNQRQVFLGIRMYCDDYDGIVPQSSHTGAPEDDCWINLLKPYVAKCDDIRICPDDALGQERKRNGGTSYVLNEYLVVPENLSDGIPSLDLWPRPAETFLAFELSGEKGVTFTEDHTHSRNWFKNTTNQWFRILADIEPDRHGGAVPPGRGAARRSGNRVACVANYLYADGHVKAIPAGRIKGWADSHFNFALPPQ